MLWCIIWAFAVHSGKSEKHGDLLIAITPLVNSNFDLEHKTENFQASLVQSTKCSAAASKHTPFCNSLASISLSFSLLIILKGWALGKPVLLQQLEVCFLKGRVTWGAVLYDRLHTWAKQKEITSLLCLFEHCVPLPPVRHQGRKGGMHL